MQISTSTLLASQQVGQVHAKPAASFAQALEKTGGFQPLPLKQTPPAQDSPQDLPATKAPQKVGSTIDIKV